MISEPLDVPVVPKQVPLYSAKDFVLNGNNLQHKYAHFSAEIADLVGHIPVFIICLRLIVQHGIHSFMISDLWSLSAGPHQACGKGSAKHWSIVLG